MDETINIFVGTIVHCSEFGTIDVLESKFLAARGKQILAIEDVGNLDEFKAQNGNVSRIVERRLGPSQFLMPGLIDGHIHAVQYPNRGLGYDCTLLDWLDTYTFPLEKRFVDPRYARTVFDAVVRTTLRHGTTTACYFGSLYTDATLGLVESVVACGQRALVGKVNMTRNAPSDYLETREQMVAETRRFVDRVLELKNDRVRPIVTPRFAINLDADDMKTLGDLRNAYDIHAQSHVCENVPEIEYVKQLFPDSDYAGVYDAAGLLTHKTVLAHGVYLTDGELQLLRQRRTAIVHCPQSNTCLRSGMCDVRRLIANGIEVGLGTDVSGGASPSILSAIRDALTTSVHLSFAKGAHYEPLNYMEAFYLATLGGAKALAMADTIGNFEVGKRFDALIIDVAAEDGTIAVPPTPLELLQKFIYLGDDRNIVSVFVDGVSVK